MDSESEEASEEDQEYTNGHANLTNGNGENGVSEASEVSGEEEDNNGSSSEEESEGQNDKKEENNKDSESEEEDNRQMVKMTRMRYLQCQMNPLKRILKTRRVK